MELPKGIQPTRVNLNELENYKEEQPGATDGGKGVTDYNERLKELWNKDKVFDHKTKASFGADQTTKDAPPPSETPNYRNGKYIILTIILIIVVLIIYYVIKRQRKVQEAMRSKMESGDEPYNYINSLRASDFGRNIMSGAEVFFYLLILFAIVNMVVKVAKTSKVVLE
jgi:hypothetical protein